MPARTDSFDLGRLRLTSGEGRRLELEVRLGEFAFGEDTYSVAPDRVPVILDISRTTANGYALRVRFAATLAGPCMRCLEGAMPEFTVDAREVEQPGGGEELESPYVEDEVLDLQRWAHDAFALELPVQVICRADCAGLCAECGVNLNIAGPEHHHESAPDPRWAKLRELRFE
jgi:uncharacterized protein